MRAAIRILPLGLLVMLCGFAAEKPVHPAAQVGAQVIVTAAPVYDPLASMAKADGERFPKGAHLLVITDGKAVPLVPNFAASADASVSFDGKTVLFAGKEDADNPWKIWEMKLADRSVRLVVAGETDLERPLYLPGGRVVYARRGEHGFGLEEVWMDGTGLIELSHIQAGALPVDVIQDGQVLFESGFPLGTSLGDGGKPELYLMYSDGSGVESYRCDHPTTGAGRWGGHQLASGDVVFTHGRTLAKFTSPLAVESAIAAPAAEYAGPVAETAAGAWVASTRKGAGRFGLSLVKPGGVALQAVYSDAANNLVEPVLLAPRTTPKRHPTALHEWKTANLLALDVRIGREGNLKQVPAMIRLEEQDESGRAVTMGTSPIEADGSFYVKVNGDRPLRFTLLDPKGGTVRAEHGWFWIRNGEQRICVGCHAGPEHASENRVPQVLLRTIIPVDLSKPVAAESKAAGGK